MDHERLGVDPRATKQDIQAACRRKALQEHPDKNAARMSAVYTSRFSKLGEAFDILKIP